MVDDADDRSPSCPPEGRDWPIGGSHICPTGADGSLLSGVAAVCETAARLSGVDGAAVAILDSVRSRELLHATDALAHHIDDLQFTLGEGPCLDAYSMGLPQFCPRLDTDRQLQRWPAFCNGVTELGALAVFAFPLPGTRGPIGVLELYRRLPGPMEPAQSEVGSECASTIVRLLRSDWTLLAGVDTIGAAFEAVSGASDHVLNPRSRFSRSAVHVASGMVAVQLGVSPGEGLVRMRAHAYAEHRAIIDVANDIVSRRLWLGTFGEDGIGAGP